MGAEADSWSGAREVIGCVSDGICDVSSVIAGEALLAGMNLSAGTLTRRPSDVVIDRVMGWVMDGWCGRTARGAVEHERDRGGVGPPGGPVLPARGSRVFGELWP